MTILIGLSALVEKTKLPYPILLVLVGLAIGFVPFLPGLELDPEIVFLVFLPPILYDAAFKTSWHEFKKEIRPISALAVSLVFFTTIIVGVAAYYLIPGFTWPLAFVLGAIISPPDAVAATSITKGLGLNRKVITIIEGESLVNDASALIAYRYALAAVGGTFVLWKAGIAFLVVALGGIGIGLAVGYVIVLAHKKVKDNAIVETSLSLLTPFSAYLLAEHFKTSGVLAVVTAGLVVAWRSREVFSTQTRLQTRAVWDTVIFLMNGMVFILIGLQMPSIVEDLRTETVYSIVGYGLVISLVTITIRIVWVFAGARLFMPRRMNGLKADDPEKVSWKNVLIVAWTGTRGVVSLATAMALPLTLADGSPFPKRHTILLLAFVVILVTLVVQGLTLPLLIRILGLKPEEHLLKQEDRELQLSLTENVLQFINDFPIDTDPKVLEQMRKRYEAMHRLLQNKNEGSRWKRREETSKLFFVSHMLSAQLEVIKFEREQLIRFHREGAYSEESLNRSERELDLEELRLQSMLARAEEAQAPEAPNP